MINIWGEGPVSPPLDPHDHAPPGSVPGGQAGSLGLDRDGWNPVLAAVQAR